ncbi:ubiquitin carboxyl-terminal hydrolase 48 [Tetranychus urticae]|uniref:Ubiquitin carboxyl-terminal hydrolase n=1 Tax=Tetranychus urticae TaxID=32264 RepID=T1K4T9_TETUR|nr:ubiquitin carboxyl-terminal hydrolase 48 [Tetranychus urticae]
MPRSETNEKATVDWAATVDVNSITWDHILKAYQLRLKSCSVKPNFCKRNCNNNPKCISGLTENRPSINKEASNINLEDEERREPGSFAGLKNLGATCYVNSLLQIWYHNPFLREAIYKWKPEDDEKEISAQLNRAVSLTDLASGVQFSPVSPIGQLQLIFARLQFSARRYVDPTQFINSLQLDVSQQQDAQEFSKLFLTLLEEDLSTQKDVKVKNIVQTQCCGEYEYVTRCSNCGTETTSSSKFYELSLNIKGHKDIHQCLDEFFSPEILEGSNQYYCNTCESKQNVIRTIRLRKCPPYLNLQLLRFIYDRQKNCRRKLNSSINFPLTLDMRKYFQETVTGCTEYHLCAVLVHRGQSAHSGHYMTHIKDRETGDWYKFDDEFVEKTEGNLIELCADGSKETSTGMTTTTTTTTTTTSSSSSSSSSPSSSSTLVSSATSSSLPSIGTPLAENSSTNLLSPSTSSSSQSLSTPTVTIAPEPAPVTITATATTTTTTTSSKSTDKEISKFSKGSSVPYMLVYKNAVLDDKKLPSDSSVQWDIPEYLQTIVVEENSIFEDHLEIKRKEREQRLAQNREKQEEMLSIYKKLIIKDEPFECINKNWLQDWSNSDSKSTSDPCEPCFDQLVEKEMDKMLNFKDEKIYIRKIQKKTDDQQEPDADDDSCDSSFLGTTRKKMKSQPGSESQSIQSLSAQGKAPRRSSRIRKYRDEREFTVSSMQTLLSLKIEIMHEFKVAPFDQELFLDEVPLQGNERTLGELKVVPNCLIYLKVDEPSCIDPSFLEEDYIKDPVPETGFKGTQLQKY